MSLQKNNKKIQNLFQQSRTLLDDFMQNDANLAKVQLFAEKMHETIKRGNKIISCGNGGSMCDAMHFAEELTGRFKKERNPLPAVSISDASHITCVANDYGFEYVFSRYIEGLGQKGDLILALSFAGMIIALLLKFFNFPPFLPNKQNISIFFFWATLTA